ncbi:DDE-type integrase/transposase/recombinase [Nesterenkonia alkaliphila]|uniref:DDE-type integrase/transposase/recombinase n=1 Tax=Nesterenkonia alkaliphila TaxID=1463631 RepID=UPI0012F96BDB|nr:DDE-type integrase/transposase/recombinase [Nesterenkonia alkaliphila]
MSRKFSRPHPHEGWVTDITQHRTRESWLYCAAVLDIYSRRLVGWSIDSKQDAALLVNALDMAIQSHRPEPGVIVHADHGTQRTSWHFGEKVRSVRLLPSFGTAGRRVRQSNDEKFLSSMQIELLNRNKWKIIVEIVNAIFEYFETFHHPQCRNSAVGYRAPIEYETLTSTTFPPRMGDRDWSQFRGAREDVVYPCSRPLPQVLP